MTDKFYLGKRFDIAGGKVTEEPLSYDPADLTTHAFVTGMTGSGKTGLCIGLMEEAALQGIPAILIDPKGDLTNLLLHFPDLAPQDFQPWLDPDLARRAGKTIEQAAADAALAWKNGLAEWNISHERMLALRIRSTLLSTLPAPMQAFPSAYYPPWLRRGWIGIPIARSWGNG